MGRQYNKVEKRSRRIARNKRKKDIVKAKKTAKKAAPKKA